MKFSSEIFLISKKIFLFSKILIKESINFQKKRFFLLFALNLFLIWNRKNSNKLTRFKKKDISALVTHKWEITYKAANQKVTQDNRVVIWGIEPQQRCSQLGNNPLNYFISRNSDTDEDLPEFGSQNILNRIDWRYLAYTYSIHQSISFFFHFNIVFCFATQCIYYKCLVEKFE